LLTENVTVADDPQLPAASAAFPSIWCEPFAAVVLFHAFCQGAPSLSQATSTPSRYHLTWVTPT
jgi:hypothetical protein